MEQINISKKILLSGLILLFAGFVIMALGSDINSFWKITFAPIVILTAFGLIVYSVMRKKQNPDV